MSCSAGSFAQPGFDLLPNVGHNVAVSQRTLDDRIRPADVLCAIRNAAESAPGKAGPHDNGSAEI